MSDVTVLCRNNGPYWIIGDFKLVDADGNPIEIPEAKEKRPRKDCRASLFVAVADR